MLAGRKLGQQCCPMPNMANSGHKHKRLRHIFAARAAFRSLRDPPALRSRVPSRPSEWITALAQAQWAA